MKGTRKKILLFKHTHIDFFPSVCLNWLQLFFLKKILLLLIPFMAAAACGMFELQTIGFDAKSRREAKNFPDVRSINHVDFVEEEGDMRGWKSIFKM